MMRSCENLSSFVIANERSKVWQSIEFELPCISGFYFVQRTRPAFFALRKTAMLAKPRKNSLTLIFARNDKSGAARNPSLNPSRKGRDF